MISEAQYERLTTRSRQPKSLVQYFLNRLWWASISI